MKYTDRMYVVRATHDHAAVATQLLNEYYAAVGVIITDTPADVDVYLTHTAAALWIAFDEDQPAGCVVMRPLPSIANAAECKRLYVRPAHRGRHIAGALMDALETCASTLGMTAVYLDSKDDLHDAIQLYERRGYGHVERYNDNPQATIFLRKSLTTAPPV